MSRFAIFVLLAAVLVVVQAQAKDRIQVPSCPENEEYTLCGRGCESTCSDPTRSQGCLSCPRFHGACRCVEGYVRDDRNNRCVKLDQCS